MLLRHILRSTLQKPVTRMGFQSLRSMSHYPIDENLYGLSSEQQQLRQTVFNFLQKELAPYAQEIDKENNFK
uniref:Acyl-CoA dehydrogenase/oxidase N-terminal domain-containing protein n=1 Tax=Phlebotomus papatasi TaxID=29031 RepID=A0A1B0GP17_PHLPP